MGIISWIIFGLIAGVIANFIMPSAKVGIVGLIILGIIGAVVGGYLGQMIFGVSITGFNLSSLVVAVAGSIVVLFFVGFFSRE